MNKKKRVTRKKHQKAQQRVKLKREELKKKKVKAGA